MVIGINEKPQGNIVLAYIVLSSFLNCAKHARIDISMPISIFGAMDWCSPNYYDAVEWHHGSPPTVCPFYPFHFFGTHLIDMFHTLVKKIQLSKS